MKGKVYYHKGAIYIEVEDIDMHTVLSRVEFLDKHPDKRKGHIFFFMQNNYGAVFFRDNRKWFEDNFTITSEVYEALDGPIDYTGKHEPTPKIDLPGITLEDYQEVSVSKMLSNHRYIFPLGCGTGKTIIALTFILSDSKVRENANYVVITKKRIISQYMEEARNFIKHINVTETKKIKDYKVPELKQMLRDIGVEPIGKRKDLEKLVNKHIGNFIRSTDRYNLYVTNYEDMVYFPKDLKIDGLIFDESHQVKSRTSGLNKTASRLAEQSENVFMMTGTPQDATRDEILAQLKVLRPYLVPTKTLTDARYFTLNDYYKVVGETRQKELDEIVSKMSYGDESENLLEEFPMAKHIEIPCTFKNKTIYNAMKKESFISLDKQTKEYVKLDWEDPDLNLDDYIIVDAKTPGVRDAKEKQIANGFVYVGTGKHRKTIMLNENPKVKPLMELIPTLRNGLIFTNFDPDIEVVSKVLDKLGRTYAIANGKMKSSDADESIQRFKRDDVEFLIAQSKSGNAGLNITNTVNTIYYSLPDSYVVYDQTTYRTRRRGRTETCYFYSLVTKGTAEKKTVRNLKNKLSDAKNQFELYRRDK